MVDLQEKLCAHKVEEKKEGEERAEWKDNETRTHGQPEVVERTTGFEDGSGRAITQPPPPLSRSK